MDLDLWIGFVIASAALLIIPGPTVTVAVGHALAGGKRAAAAAVPGVVLGDAVAMTASLLGAGAILAASATLFTALKIAGAAYLIWLGVQMWRKPGGVATVERGEGRPWAVFRSCFLVTALNPKDIVFFVAFVPQFVTADAPLWPQFLTLQATFLTMVAMNIGFWTLSAARFSTAMRRQSRMRVLQRIGGACLFGAGLLTARA